MSWNKSSKTVYCFFWPEMYRVLNIYQRILISPKPDIKRGSYRCNWYPVERRSLRYDKTPGVLSRSHVVNKV